ncbi:hypothetical protein N7G274_005054 [Stereocaulon virgatum]|uniref:Actin-like ATPase domain-containing protein n=1 Tax=Stereocaulon virgatum TaxID=373712 RepID=A0ABR4A9W5_9LECA
MSKATMATTAGYFDRRHTSSVRPGLSHLQPDPSSPHTPQQQQRVSSALSSPSVSYRAEEEAVIFEFGTRHLSAGFTGESYPRCRLGFGPEESRRIGDHRSWLPGYDERPRKKQRVECWGENHELWRMDLRGSDVGVVEDKIERAVREAFTKYLLLDSKSRRLLVILPSIMPHQLLSTLLSTLFNNFQIPSITLLSPSILSTVAAGCRSSLVVDIGWRETVLTAVYDYREVCQTRTTRAMSMVTLEMARLLKTYDRHNKKDAPLAAVEISKDEEAATLSIGFDRAEEVTTRMAWCRSGERDSGASQDLSDDLKRISMVEDANDRASDGPAISIPSPSFPSQSISIPFSQFARPVETSLLATSKRKHDHDDHEQPLHTLLYDTLLTLPPDVRSVCMSRVIITGGGSNIPGLKPRLLDELSAIVKERGWDPVQSRAADERRRRLKDISANPQVILRTDEEVPKDPSTILSAAMAPQATDPFEEKLRRERNKDSKGTVSGVIRGVVTLGAWTGGSLIANLRIKGVVEIEKDSFLQHGLAGARREAEASNVQQKVVRGERAGWTLGAWA